MAVKIGFCESSSDRQHLFDRIELSIEFYRMGTNDLGLDSSHAVQDIFRNKTEFSAKQVEVHTSPYPPYSFFNPYNFYSTTVIFVKEKCKLQHEVAQHPLCGIQVGAHGFNLPRSRRIAMKASG